MGSPITIEIWLHFERGLLAPSFRFTPDGSVSLSVKPQQARLYITNHIKPKMLIRQDGHGVTAQTLTLNRG